MKRADTKETLGRLRSLSNPNNVVSMARFGVNPKNTCDILIPVLRKMAKELGGDHELALRLRKSGIHEARILATMVDTPEEVPQHRWKTGSVTSIHGMSVINVAAIYSTGPPSPREKLLNGVQEKRNL